MPHQPIIRKVTSYTNVESLKYPVIPEYHIFLYNDTKLHAFPEIKITSTSKMEFDHALKMMLDKGYKKINSIKCNILCAYDRSDYTSVVNLMTGEVLDLE